MLLWPPKYAHKWPVHAARLGCRNVVRTPDMSLHPPHPLVASWTHALPGVWTSMDTYFYHHPSTRTNGQCTRPGWDAETLGGTPDISLHLPHPLVASWTHALPGVWTSLATYFYGHPSTRTICQCTRPGWDAEMLRGPPTLVCTHHTRWLRRGRMHYPVCGLLWPHTSITTQVRTRMVCARGPVGMQKR